MSMHIGLGPNH